MRLFPLRVFPLRAALLAALALAASPPSPADAQTRLETIMAAQWRGTDCDRVSIPLDEIMSGGPPRDGIPAILEPRFAALAEAQEHLAGREPVISVTIKGDARAYLVQILTRHEIANDVVGGVPVAVTYCPLCNAAIVFDRRDGAQTLSFGVSGLLRKSDMIMYDHQAESWWQQFTGEAVVGALMGQELTRRPARIEALDAFAERYPDGLVLAPPTRWAAYGRNPYVSYDSAARPFLFNEPLPEGLEPMRYVVVVDDAAWDLGKIAEAGVVEDGDLRFTAAGEMASALDTPRIADGRAIPSVIVERRQPDGGWAEAPYDLTFAFVFHAFAPNGDWRL